MASTFMTYISLLYDITWKCLELITDKSIKPAFGKRTFTGTQCEVQIKGTKQKN